MLIKTAPTVTLRNYWRIICAVYKSILNFYKFIAFVLQTKKIQLSTFIFILPVLPTQKHGWGSVIYFSLEKGSNDENLKIINLS
jgi:hypothetical protein